MLICTDHRTGSGCGTSNPDGTSYCQKCGKSLHGALHLRDPGTEIDRYRILSLIGNGGFGAVYVAEVISQTHVQVALKETFDPAMVRSFEREFHALQHLRHPNLPRYYAMFEAQGNGYLVMELVRGQSLDQILQRQREPLLESQVLGYAMQLCDVLHYLHSQNPPILHRDIKPANIRLTPDGVVKLVDFGLLKQEGQNTYTSISGALTPAYAPIEQYAESTEHTNARSDIYSLGATLYHLLTCQRPTPSLIRASQKPDSLPPPDHLTPTLSPAVTSAITRAISLSQHERYPTVLALKHALLDTSQPPVATPPDHLVETQVLAQTRVLEQSVESPGPVQLVGPDTPHPHPATAPPATPAGHGSFALLLWWVLANVVGWALGELLAGVMALSVGWDSLDDIKQAVGTAVGGMMLGMVGGATMGAIQWLILRRFFAVPLWWIVTGIAGWAVGWATGWPIVYQVGMGMGFIVGGILGGIALGGAQWLILNRRIPNAGWWVLASALGWAVGEAPVWLMRRIGAESAVAVLGGSIIGLGYGLITGIALVALLQQLRHQHG